MVIKHKKTPKKQTLKDVIGLFTHLLVDIWIISIPKLTEALPI
jgi:hypothetical protein